MSAVNLAKCADRVAYLCRHDRITDLTQLRDLADLVSGGDLDTMRLDILCDMVQSRLRWSDR